MILLKTKIGFMEYKNLIGGAITDKISIYNCDCMELLKQTPDNYYSLSLVDPPYGININISIGRRKGDRKSNYKKFAGNDSKIPDKPYFEELFSVSKNQIIWGGNYMTEFLKPSPCWILWDKGFSESVTFAQFEMAWTSFSSSTKKYDFNAAANNNRIHPTQKPVALYEWLIKNYAKDNDKILDTHGGSMSSRIAAHKANLPFMGFELDEDYFKASVKRFEQYTNQTRLF